MTQSIIRTHSILGVEFDLDELRDIVNHGCVAGVSGFTYYHETTDAYNEHDDEIQDYLSDWCHDNGIVDEVGNSIGSFAHFAPDAEDITQLKNQLVWSYLELKAHDILTQYDPNY